MKKAKRSDISKDNKQSNHLLEVEKLSIFFNNSRSVVKAIDDVSMFIDKGETVSVIGESGSGKTTLGKSILSLIPHTSGKVTFNGRRLPSSPELKRKYGNYSWMAKNMQMIFQDPYSSLHPTWSVYKVATQGLKFHSSFQDAKNHYKQNKKIVFWNDYFKYIKDESKIARVNELSNIINVEKKQYIEKFATDRLLYESEIQSLKSQIKSQRIILRIAKRSKNETNINVETEKLSMLVNDIKTKKVAFFDKFNEVIEHYKKIKEFNTIISKQVVDWKKEYAEVSKNKEGVDIINSKFIEFTTKLDEKYNQELDVIQKNYLEKREKWLEAKNEVNSEYSVAKIKNELNNIKHIFKQEKEVLKTRTQSELQDQELHWIEEHIEINPWYMAKIASKVMKREYSFKSKKAFIYDVISKFLKQVGIAPAMLTQPISDLSGGQRQRIAIARALVMNAKFIVADEPISALDVSIQAQVINILNDMKEQLGLTILFIAHDLRMVRHISDRIYIVFKGKVVESGETEEVFTNPIHPYTRTLLSAIPSINAVKKGFNVYKYDLETLVKERSSHELILVDGKDHYVHGTDELIKKWSSETKAFIKEYVND